MTTGHRQFKDRRDAGKRLAAVLVSRHYENPLVLALPRGGVPVAYEVAEALGAPLDILLVRKIGAPGNPEVGIGALVDGSPPQPVIDEELVRYVGATPEHIERVVGQERTELERRRLAYGRPPLPPLDGRTVILVDDGIATGGTIRAALKGLRQREVGRIVVAVPVAPQSVIDALRPECDDVLCLEAPAHFLAVGAHYADFAQTSDEEVRHLLRRADIHY